MFMSGEKGLNIEVNICRERAREAYFISLTAQIKKYEHYNKNTVSSMWNKKNSNEYIFKKMLPTVS